MRKKRGKEVQNWEVYRSTKGFTYFYTNEVLTLFMHFLLLNPPYIRILFLHQNWWLFCRCQCKIKRGVFSYWNTHSVVLYWLKNIKNSYYLIIHKSYNIFFLRKCIIGIILPSFLKLNWVEKVFREFRIMKCKMILSKLSVKP